MTRKIDTKDFMILLHRACPWFHRNTIIEVEGDAPDAWGRDWWRQCKDEIEKELADE